MATPYKIHLDTYDGPLDLLLDLIRKQEMDIHNIPIARITGQYLEYLHKLEKLDIDVSADFIYMAATLILIKSKMLLPPDPLAGPDEQIDPRAELVHRLVEHEQFKSAAQLLYQKQQLEAHVWSKPDRSLYEGEDVQGELVVSLVDLVRVFQQVLERRKEVVKIELHHDTLRRFLAPFACASIRCSMWSLPEENYPHLRRRRKLSTVTRNSFERSRKSR